MQFPTCAYTSVRIASEPVTVAFRSEWLRNEAPVRHVIDFNICFTPFTARLSLFFFQFLSSSALSAILRTPGNDVQRLAAAAALVRPRYKALVPFFSFLLTFSTIFLYVRHNGDVYTHFRHRSFVPPDLITH
jgi:hypothetical protein